MVFPELNIGTTSQAVDVIANGVVAKEFNIEYESGLAFKKSHYRIDELTHNQMFYVSNRNNSLDIHEVIIETKDESILSASVEVPRRGAADYIGEDEVGENPFWRGLDMERPCSSSIVHELRILSACLTSYFHIV